MSEVVYSCPYVPAEWIAAHGLKPSRRLPSFPPPSAPVMPNAGVCPYMRAFVNTVSSEPDTGSIILTTVCDQMRRAHDILILDSNIPVLMMHIPRNWQRPAALEMYLSELERLGRFLVSRGGNSPTGQHLAEVMDLYDRARKRLRMERSHFPPRAFSEAIVSFHRDGIGKLPLKTTPVTVETIPLALLGGPLSVQGFGLFDIITRYGGSVVLDATESGEMTMPASFDKVRMAKEPLRELARSYYENIPAPFRRPNTELYEWIARKIRQRKIRGVILVRYLWCDIWHVEVQRLRELLDVPILDIDLGGDDPIARFTTRIQAFIENLI